DGQQAQLKKVLAAKGPTAVQIVQQLQAAQTQAKAGEYAKAHAAMDDVDRMLVEAVRAGAQAEATSAVPKGKVPITATRMRWMQVKAEAFKGTAELAAALKKDGDEAALDCAKIIEELSSDFPAELENSLELLNQAVEA